MPQSAPPFALALLLGLGLFWGLNWPGMKIILAELPVFWFRVSCLLVGGIGLLIISRASGNSIAVPRRVMVPLVITSFMAIGCWHICSAYGVSLVPAGRASIIAFTMPIWSSLFAVYMLGERFSWQKAVGLILGGIALMVLLIDDLAAIGGAPAGLLLMLTAAITWAFGTNLFRRGPGFLFGGNEGWGMNVATNIGWQLTIMAPVMLIGALLFEEVPDLTQVSRNAWIALAFIYAFPMLFCQWAFFKVVSMVGASLASIGTLLVPIVGVFSGAIVLGEPIGWQEITALVAVVTGLSVVMLLPSRN